MVRLKRLKRLDGLKHSRLTRLVAASVAILTLLAVLRNTISKVNSKKLFLSMAPAPLLGAIHGASIVKTVSRLVPNVRVEGYIKLGQAWVTRKRGSYFDLSWRDKGQAEVVTGTGNHLTHLGRVYLSGSGSEGPAKVFTFQHDGMSFVRTSPTSSLGGPRSPDRAPRGNMNMGCPDGYGQMMGLSPGERTHLRRYRELTRGCSPKLTHPRFEPSDFVLTRASPAIDG